MEEQNKFCKGDFVRILGQDYIGEIVRVSHKYAAVAFKAMEANIALGQLEKAQSVTSDGVSTLPNQPAKCPLNLDADAFTSFNPEIDLHGMSVSDALKALDRWIDKAYLLGHMQLKIIHGKGSGALRNAVRAYLQSHGQVKRVIAQHPYPGGEGVTWVEVD